MANNATKVYVVEHKYRWDGDDLADEDDAESKFIGVFSTHEKAADAITLLRTAPGFEDRPDDFITTVLVLGRLENPGNQGNAPVVEPTLVVELKTSLPQMSSQPSLQNRAASVAALDAIPVETQSQNQMVLYPGALATFSENDVDRLFHALADATRRDILRRTLANESSVTGLAHEYDMSFAAVRKHVGVLEQAGLVSKLRRGREQIVRGEPTGVQRVNDLMDAYEVIWRHRLRALDSMLDEQR